MKPIGVGALRKMTVEIVDGLARYRLRLHSDDGDGPREIDLNALVGVEIRMEYLGEILCVHCGRRSNRSFAQGYCYPCFKSLAACDLCVLNPSICHHAEGSCREPQWGQEHCMIEHWLYLANTSGLKVGLTRCAHAPTRWLDQGAAQAVPILKAHTRRQAGMIEKWMSGRGLSEQTQWRKMLGGEPEPLPMAELAADWRAELEPVLGEFCTPLDPETPEFLNESPREFRYPIERYPQKPRSLKFDKQAIVEGRLQGMKGQYLMVAGDVVNVRSMAGRCIRFSAD